MAIIKNEAYVAAVGPQMPSVGERSKEGAKNEEVHHAIDASACATQYPAGFDVVGRDVGSEHSSCNGETQSNERKNTEYPEEYCDSRDLAVRMLASVQG